MLSSLAAVLASSPKNLNLYPTSTIKSVSICFLLISKICSSKGVNFPVLAPFFLVFARGGVSSSPSSPSPSSSNAAVSSSTCQFLRLICAMLSGCPNFLTNFLCNCSLLALASASSSSSSAATWLGTVLPDEVYANRSVRENAFDFSEVVEVDLGRVEFENNVLVPSSPSPFDRFAGLSAESWSLSSPAKTLFPTPFGLDFRGVRASSSLSASVASAR
jgi:hypothetical protein